jgi:2-dehydro-3-deoxygluconokinase
MVSYDLNYRPSLWKAIGGARRAQEVNRRLVRDVDVILGNEEDFTACLGLEVEGTDDSLSMLPAEGFKAMIEQAAAAYPNFQVIATTLRAVKTATVNDWSAIAWSRSGGFAESARRPGLEILDRVGGGDSFASGLIFGLLSDLGLHMAVEYGAAHGALAMTTPGDTSTARKEEVDRLVAGAGARADR